MRLVMMMAMQAAVAGPSLPAELRPAKPAAPARPCGETDAQGEIVVCGRDREADRLRPVDPNRYAEKPIRATTHIGKVAAAAEVEQGGLPDGRSAPRAMLHFKLPF
ncbi:MAG: 5'-nucleotidase [Sphingomonas taxi]